MAVIDASVYVALINAKEEHHATSWKWFEDAQASGESIIAPAILLAEVASALSRGVGDSALAHRAVEHIKRAGIIEVVPVALPIAELAASIAADHQIRGCDAIYVATAKQYSETLITLDRQQLEWAISVVSTRAP
jgi:predicted nucleic acid-binding protein